MVTAGTVVLFVFTVSLVWAHFQVLIPSQDIVTVNDDKTINLHILFTHPMEQGPIMNMQKPMCFGVLVGGKKHDLMGTLEAKIVSGKTTYGSSYRVKEPS